MSEWKKVKLGEISQYVNDKIAITDTYESNYVSTDSMLKNRGGIIAPESIPSDGNVTKYQSDDILVSNIRPYFKKIWFSNREGGCSNDVLVFRTQKGVSARFLYYRLSGDAFFDYMMASANGTKMPRGNRKLILNYSFDLPSLHTQHRIATILSRYDSLIENYQKQIKLLEEAAQRLYKEWFVDLHFPSHESTRIVDGVPEGWEKKAIGDIVVYYDKQRKPLSLMQRMNMEKIYPYYGAAALMDYVDNYLFDGIYLLLGEDGTVITPDKFPVLQYVWGKFWVNNHAHVLRGKEGISTEFLYSMFKEMPIADIVTGAAQPKISQGRLSNKKILMPSLELIQEWSSIAKHFFDRLRVLSEQIRLLTEARDRLLPKLMNGEIKV